MRDDFDILPDPVARFDRSLRLSYVNAAALAVSGSTAAQWLGVRLSDVAPPEWGAQGLEAQIEGVFASGEPSCSDFDYRGPDGIGVSFEARLIPELGEGGEVLAVVAVGRDVTARRVAERALLERVKEMKCLSMISDRLRQPGAPTADDLAFITRHLPSGWHFPDEAVAQVVLEEQSFGADDFEAAAVKLTAPVVAHGEPVGSIGVGYRDLPSPPGDPFLPEESHLIEQVASRLGDAVTRRRRAEQARASEERFRALIEKSSELVAVIGRSGEITYASPSGDEILGGGRDPKNIFEWDAVHPDDRERMGEALQQILQDPTTSVTVEVRISSTLDGSWRRMSFVARNLYGVPAVDGIVINGRDVTQAHELRRQLLQSQKMEAVGRLAGGIAHDFNNLLTVIRAHADFLFHELDPNSPSRADATEIRNASDRAAALTRQLLAFSKQQILEPEVVDLNEAVRDAERMLTRLIGEHIELSTKLLRDAPPIEVDRNQLDQVIVNLVVNAREELSQGGFIEIEVKRRCADTGEEVGFTVRDSGRGIPPEHLERIFDPFFTTKDGGTGLGLATVRGIVEQSGGSVEAASAAGRGAVFTVWLPAARPTIRPSAARAKVAPSMPPPSAAATIMVVEDDPGVRAAVRRALASHGFRVFATDDADKAVQWARDNVPDLLLSDVVMPGVSGPEVARRVREVRPELPVVFMTGYAADTLTPDDLVVAGEAVLQKPFSPSTLITRIQAVLGR